MKNNFFISFERFLQADGPTDAINGLSTIISGLSLLFEHQQELVRAVFIRTTFEQFINFITVFLSKRHTTIQQHQQLILALQIQVEELIRKEEREKTIKELDNQGFW